MAFHSPEHLLTLLENWQADAQALTMAQALQPLTLVHGVRRVSVLPYGATVMQIELQTDPADASSFQPLTLAYDSPLQYLQDPFALGVTVGRFANRIAGARYTDPSGQAHQLDASQPPHCLHGGRQGFGKKIWQVLEQRDDFLLLYLDSPAGDQGFPGRLQVFLQLWLTGDRLCQRFHAISDALTVVNLTNHCYFNLNGDADVSRHQLQVDADAVLLVDDSGIPTAAPLRLEPAAAPCITAEPAASSQGSSSATSAALASLFDLRKPTPLDGRFARADHSEQALLTHGLDHCFITRAGASATMLGATQTAVGTGATEHSVASANVGVSAQANAAEAQALANAPAVELVAQPTAAAELTPAAAHTPSYKPAVQAELSAPLPLQARLTAPLSDAQLTAPNTASSGLRVASEPARQRVLEVYSSQPGLQVYRGNYLSAPFAPYQAVCLEAQNFPDAPNRADFPASWLEAGQWYVQQIDYRFYDQAVF